MTSLLEFALALTDLGFKVFPLKPRGKTPLLTAGWKELATTDREQLHKWWIDTPNANIGLPAEANGLGVLDIDRDHNGFESLKKLQEKYGCLPDTVRVRTGGGGEHWYYKLAEDQELHNCARLHGLDGIDIRGCGGYLVAVGSVHESGERYQWLGGHSPDDIAFAAAPGWLENKPKRSAGRTVPPSGWKPDPDSDGARCLDRALQLAVPGNRDETAFQLGCQLRDCRLSEMQAEPFMLDYARRVTGHAYTGQEALRAMSSAFTQSPRTPIRRDRKDKDIFDFQPTEAGAAEWFVAHFGRQFRYDVLNRRWLAWAKHYWQPDDMGKVHQAVKQSSRLRTSAVLEALGVEKEGEDEYVTAQRSTNLRWAKSAESDRGRNALLRWAQSEGCFPITPDKLDRQPWLIACPNGVVDLRNGSIRNGKPEDLITVHTNTRYKPAAKCPAFMRFLSDVMDGDEEMVGFIQRALGYTLSGSMRAQRFFVCLGDGENGKDMLLEAIHDLFGGYAIAVAPSVFREERFQSHTTDLADLAGVRMGYTTETGAGGAWDVEMIKRISHGGLVRCRRMRADNSQFFSQCAPWFAFNSLPKAKDTSRGFWRSAEIITFPVTFVAKEELKERRESQPHRVFKLKRDRDKLKRALQAEAEGILAWVVAGAEAFHKGDLQSPKKITVAKEEYRKSSHPLSDFVDACCTKGAGLTVAGAEFYRAYQLYHDHARTPRADRLGPVEFGVVAKVDFDWGKSNGLMCYRNVGLIHVYEQHAEGEAWKQ